MAKQTLTMAVTKMDQSLQALVAVNVELVALMKRQLLPTATNATPAPAPKAEAPKAEAPKSKEKAAPVKKAPAAKPAKPAPIPGFWYLPLSGGSAVPVSVGLPAGDGRRWVLFKGGNWRKVDPRRVYDAKGWLEV